MKLLLEDELFTNARMDFNRILERTIFNMEEKNAVESTINLKLNIHLENGKDFSEIEPKDIILPLIKHEVSSTIQIKTKESGIIGGNNQRLEWDKANCVYVIRDMDTDQFSIL